jgi:ADP-ribose pyrophosphatase YjhB (NUDIX family)
MELAEGDAHETPRADGSYDRIGVRSQWEASVTRSDSLVHLRCSAVLFDGDRILLVHRTKEEDDWVLPGGRPLEGESMASCVRRETLEETGLQVTASRFAFVLEVGDPEHARRIVDMVFLADRAGPRGEPQSLEAGREPEFVSLSELSRLRMRPPIAGYLRGLPRGRAVGAAYLGNLWRPDEALDEADQP